MSWPIVTATGAAIAVLSVAAAVWMVPSWMERDDDQFPWQVKLAAIGAFGGTMTTAVGALGWILEALT